MDKYNQIKNGNTNVHFTNAMFGSVERSRLTATPLHYTTFNAGDIVPVYCREILPDEELSISLDYVIRQTTLLTPTMGNMNVDFYAFFVPNRIVNKSWKAVEGENYSGSWTANAVSLATLLAPDDTRASVQIPVGSLADYYGFPTQRPIPAAVLKSCHDLKFRGYAMIYNEWFRDQNYQPPIPLSTLNVNQGFMRPAVDSDFSMCPPDSRVVGLNAPDGSVGAGAIANALYGSGRSKANWNIHTVNGDMMAGQSTRDGVTYTSLWALDKPLKACKLHDYFTSVLPSPQKSMSDVLIPVSGSVSSIPVTTSASDVLSGAHNSLRFKLSDGGVPVLLPDTASSLSTSFNGTFANKTTFQTSIATQDKVYPSNLQTEDGASVTGLEVSVNDLRMASAIQQVYETMARGGSRYRELVQSFFGIEVDDPFSDIPQCLGHIRADLELYQTAQTSPSESGSTPQGNLAAFGYTSNSGHLFSHRFVEHGYIHIFAVVRHRNIYSSFLARDNFRLSALDFYTPPLANISEQPVYTREINPFAADSTGVFGYQEAWAEYRYEPDQVSGYMRPGVSESLSIWNYADEFSDDLVISNSEWLRSNSEEVLNRTLAVNSSLAPQFKCQVRFNVDKTLPMPTYSVPGLDII